MKNMKTFAAIAASTLAIAGAGATTAQAQSWNHGYYNNHSNDRLATPYVSGLDWKITNAARRGVISWDQARHLREEAREIQPLSYRYEMGRARPDEVARLSAVVNRIDSITSGYAYNQRRPYWR